MFETSALISFGIIVVSALGLIGLERLFPYDRGQRVLRDGFWTDFLWYGLFQSYILGLLIAQLIRWMDEGSGLSRLHLVSDWPLWLQCVFFFFLHDLYIYWFHRWQHSNAYLWRVHEAHHSVKSVDWLSGTRSHALEILINQTIEFAPIVLLGGAPEVRLFKGVIDAVWGMYIHSNINARSGWLQYFLNGPEMHRWHHATNIPMPGRNFATKIAVWDWIFGTAHRPALKPAAYGLDDVKEFPPNYFVQQVFAFRSFEEPAAEQACSPQQ